MNMPVALAEGMNDAVCIGLYYIGWATSLR